MGKPTMDPWRPFSPSTWAALLAHVQEDWPREACGLVLRSGELVKTLRGSNIASVPTREYLIDAGTLTHALRMEREGWSVAAVYHSHTTPGSTPALSATDVAHILGRKGRPCFAEAAWVVIATPEPPGWQAGAYQWNGVTFTVVGAAEHRAAEARVQLPSRPLIETTEEVAAMDSVKH